MTERPILFSALMVRALLAGNKTQTRRLMKPQPVNEGQFLGERIWRWDYKRGCLIAANESHAQQSWLPQCPYGTIGDRLWVREAFYIDLSGSWRDYERDEVLENLYYRADGECCAQIPECQCADVGKPRWSSPLHLPRWASRLTLQITDVRVQRLHELTSEDAIAEGVDCFGGFDYPDPVGGFIEVWNKINGESAWERNDWVWALSFEVVK